MALAYKSVIDFVAAAYGAKRVQASKLAIAGAFIGTIVGIAGGLFGLLFGPLIGAFIGELIAQQNSPGGMFSRASEVGFATWFGMMLGMVTKVALSFAMVTIFIAAYFWK